MTIIDNSFQTLSSVQPDSLGRPSSQESQSGDFKSQLVQEVGDFAGPSGGLAWVRSFRAYDPSAQPNLPLKEGMLISALAGSQHPGFDSITGANYEVPDGWKLTRTLGGIPYLVHMNTLEKMQVPYTAKTDPNNTYPVPLLPLPGPGSEKQTLSGYRVPSFHPSGPTPEIANNCTAGPCKTTEDDKDGAPLPGAEVRTEDLKKQEAATLSTEGAAKANFGRIADSWIARLLDRYVDQDRHLGV